MIIWGIDMFDRKTETKHILRLLWPILTGNLIQISMNFLDTYMSGKAGKDDVAGVGAAGSIWFPMLLLGHGIVISVVPTIAKLVSMDQKNSIVGVVHQVFWIMLIFSAPFMVALYNSDILIHIMDDGNVKHYPITIGYLHAVMWGAPAYLLFAAIRSVFDGLSDTKPGMVIYFTGAMFNIPLNYIFIEGKLGAPRLGGVGCGVATAIVYWIMFLSMLGYAVYAKKRHSLDNLFQFSRPNISLMTQIFIPGISVGVGLFFEVALFAGAALMLSPLGSTVVSAHQIVLNFDSIIFMLPLSIGTTVSIRMGHYIGKMDKYSVQMVGKLGMALAFLSSIFTGLLAILARNIIPRIYIEGEEVVLQISSCLMIFVAAYQCIEAMQCIGSSILRGYKDTIGIFSITCISYVGIGMSLCYILGFTDIFVPHMGVFGVWTGFVVSVVIASALYLYRINQLQKYPIEHFLYKS